MAALFIIEHLEPRMWPWCVIEYKRMRKLVGKNLLITNTKSKLVNFAKTDSRSVNQLKPKNACILDPSAQKELVPEDANSFDAFVFGGILGDDPPQNRTTPAFQELKGERRNLGKEQMSTDTAVHVTWQILHGKKLSELQFQDRITISISDEAEIQLPYRYLVKNNKPVLAPGLHEYLRNRKGF